MKTIFFLLLVICMSCNNSNKTTLLEKRVDSLKEQLSYTYKPGLGEFMSTIQMHHAKLWFAGINGNWQLADFEINEIKESIEDIEKFCPERPEIKSLASYLPSGIDSINYAIGKQDIKVFKDEFLFLTSSCNNCHKANGYGINVVTIPTTSPVSNQDFKPVIKQELMNPVVQMSDSAKK